MHQKKEKNGIDSMLKNSALENGKKENTYALFATKNMRPKKDPITIFAAIIVNQQTEENLESTMLKEIVKGVQFSLR